MSDAMMEARRIGNTDCLADCLADLRMQARHLAPWDADAREGWMQACGDLLEAVPDALQRTSWAYFLAQDLRLVGTPIEFVMGRLLHRAAQGKAART